MLYVPGMSQPVETISERVQQFVHDLSFYSIGNVVPALLALVGLMLFSRVFAPDSFGRYSLALAVAGISSTLLYGWLDYSVLRYAPQFDENLVIRNTATMYIGISAVFGTVAVAGYWLFGDHLGEYAVFYWAALALALARGAVKPLLAFFRATLSSRSVTLFQVIDAVVALVVSIGLAIFLFEHIVGWVWGTAIGLIVTAGLIYATSDKVRGTPLFQRDLVGRMFHYGIPMIGFIVGDTMLMQADRVLLEFLVGSAAVGIYSANYMIVDRGLRLAYTPIIQSIVPIIIDSWEEDNEPEIRDMLTDFTRYFILLGIPALVLVAVLSKTVSTLVVGEGYEGGFVVIPVVSVGLFLWSLANVGQVVFQLVEKTSVLSVGILGAIAVNLGLNVPLIASFGYLGAAVATTVSYAVYWIFVAVASSRYMPWEIPLSCFRNALIAGLLMAVPSVALYVLDLYSLLSSIVAAAIGVPIYLGTIYLLGEIERESLVMAIRHLQ